MLLKIEEKQEKNDENKVYTYEEAVEMAGTGWYNTSLTMVLSVTMLSMCIDLYSISVIVSHSTCDFQLNLAQKSILVSIPFAGPVVTAYVWGYISDTRGRRFSLLIGIPASFLMTTLSAFSTNWIMLAVLKFIGTSFSSCANSTAYTLLGESCPERTKGYYLIVMSSIVHSAMAVYFALSYLTGYLDFVYDLGFITFVPWRLLALMFAIPLGFSAFCLLFYYESPKYLLSVGNEAQALIVLKNICRRNGNNVENFTIQKLVLNEEGNITRKNVPLLQSMREQTLPLFKPPFVWRILLMYYFTFVIYSTSGSLYMWMPLLAEGFSFDGAGESKSFCSMLMQNTTLSSKPDTTCNSVSLTMLITAVICGVALCSLNALMAILASRKKALMIVILTVGCASCVLTAAIPNNISGFFYFGVLINGLCMGNLFTYYVELFPTSFRGMASCLGVMVARISSFAGINILGPFIISNCTATFYSIAALLISALLMTYFLPPDRAKKLHQSKQI